MKPIPRIPNTFLVTDILGFLSSYGNLIFPNKYSTNPIVTRIHSPINISLFSRNVLETKSALERNFKANATSIKPNTTFTVFIQPPDFGNDCNACGKRASNPKTIAHASPKPPKAKVNNTGIFLALEATPPSKLPRIGPVQENETITNVRAIKKIPIIPPASSAFADLLAISLVA